MIRTEPGSAGYQSSDPRQQLATTVSGDTAGTTRAATSVLLKILLPLLGLGIAVAAWWWYTVAFDVPAIILPSPPDVVAAFGRSSDLIENARVTTIQSALGFGIAVGAGLLTGGILAHSRVVNQMTYPWLVAFNAVPKVAIAPLLVVWMGFGMQPRVALAVLVCFFPVVLATVAGLRATPTELDELARSLDASRLKTFLKVRFPHALPQIFIGLKVALPLAIIGSVIGELQSGRTGLGAMVKQASTDRAVAFAALVVLALISIVLFYLLVAIERRLLPWVRATTAQ